jgi:hypothetical protein
MAEWLTMLENVLRLRAECGNTPKRVRTGPDEDRSRRRTYPERRCFEPLFEHTDDGPRPRARRPENGFLELCPPQGVDPHSPSLESSAQTSQSGTGLWCPVGIVRLECRVDLNTD